MKMLSFEQAPPISIPMRFFQVHSGRHRFLASAARQPRLGRPGHSAGNLWLGSLLLFGTATSAICGMLCPVRPLDASTAHRHLCHPAEYPHSSP
jgi:hypothetical protein